MGRYPPQKSRTLPLCALIVTAVTTSACPSPSPEEASPTSKPSLLDRIRGRGELVVAVPYEGRPPKGEINPSLTTYTGFEVDLARSLADSLGVQLRFAPSPADARSTLSPGDGVHISFPQRTDVPGAGLASIPYLDSEVRLLVQGDGRTKKRRDGGRGPVCSTVRPPPDLGVTTLRGTLEGCLALLEARRVTGVLGYDVALGKLATSSNDRLALVEGSLDVVPLSAVVVPGGDDLLAHFDQVITSAQKDGRLEAWRERWVARFEH